MSARRPTRAAIVSIVFAALLIACDEHSAHVPASVDDERSDATRALITPTRLVDRTLERGIDFVHERGASERRELHEIMGGGVAWLDHDQDGDPDLYLTSGCRVDRPADFEGPGRNRLYRNDGGRFIDVTARTGTAGRGYTLGALAADIDNDGDPDLLLLRHGRDLLLRNRGGVFEEIEASGLLDDEPFSGGAAFGDFDLDGDLDLFTTRYVHLDPERDVRCSEPSLEHPETRIDIYCGPAFYPGTTPRLYHNRGDGTFVDATTASGVGLGRDRRAKGLGTLATDLDDDGDVDIFVACDTSPNLLYRNRGDGTFDEVGLELGVGASEVGTYEGGMGIAWGDLDGDARLDLVVTNFENEPHRVWLAERPGAFRDATIASGIGTGSRPLVGWGCGLFDAACDGTPDLLVVNGHTDPNAERWTRSSYRQPIQLLRRSGERWVDGARAAGLREPSASRGAASADFDLDGDVDWIIGVLDGPPRLLASEGARGRFLEIELTGEGAGGRDAIGARVRVEIAGLAQVAWSGSGGSYLSSSDRILHFGLGDATHVDRVEVRWPGGRTSERRNIAGDQRIRIGPEPTSEHR